ncbi:RNA polymerase sigma factor [Planctomycetes bacterium Poly30]|uniref:RNA polymerase sigma factor n=1 Tax=Saltatorellus ferox TaxID=2528018 RepID=A0A518ENX5_9BACT|nr:RNA polymerase sigma factor [Planctomycetes bacterium Poly30]
MRDSEEELPERLEQLLQQQGRLRALARGLVRDPGAVDDLVQDTMLDAATRESEADAADTDRPRPWARVIANLARSRSRSDVRRRRREVAAAQSEAQPSAAEEAMAAEAAREMVDAVQDLDEPYREAIVLRYFEGLSPGEIVDRTGATPAAVKKQLHRGLSTLRARLEARMGPNQPWAILLLPALKSKATGSLASRSKGLTLNQWGAVAGCAAILGVAVFRATIHGTASSADAASDSVASREAAAANAPPDPVVAADPASASSTRTGAEASGRTTVADAARRRGEPGARRSTGPLPRYARSFRARLVDDRGRPLGSEVLKDLRFEFRFSEAEIALHGPPTTLALQPDAEGWLESDLIPRSPLFRHGRLGVTAGDWSLLAIGFEGEDRPDGRAVLMPAVRVAGVVLDAGGAPVADALVSISADLASLGTYPGGLLTDTSVVCDPVTTDTEGRFDLGSVPSHSGFTLYAGRPDTGGVRVAVPSVDRADLMLQLGLPQQVTSTAVTGRVVTPRGDGVEDAAVHLGWLETRTDREGWFRLESSADALRRIGADGHRLIAVTSDGRFDHLEFDAEQMGPHVVRIPRAMETLEGRLLGVGGEPLVGAMVSVLNGTRPGGSVRSLEEGLDGEPERTSENGRFELTHLEPRPYSLRFLRRDPFLVFDAEGLTPGTEGIQVRLPSDHAAQRVTGRVLGVHGEPLVGLRVSPLAFPTEGRSLYYWAVEGASFLTDADGRFELPTMPRKRAFLHFDPRPNDRVEGELVAVEKLDLDGPIEVVLALACEVMPTLREGSIGSVLRFTDRSGASVRVTRVVPGGMRIEDEVRQAEDGSFGLLRLPASTARVEVRAGSGELMRTVELRLDPMVLLQPTW